MPDYSTQIAQLEELLDSGMTETVVDGEKVVFASPDEIRKRLRELKSQTTGGRPTRPRMSTMTFRNA